MEIKPKRGHEDENSSGSNLGGEVRPIDRKDSLIPSIDQLAASSKYNKAPRSSKKRKQYSLDSDSEHEMVKIRKGDAHLRDPTELPIIATASSGERKTLWAKMDTGADLNIITDKLIARLGLTNDIEPVNTGDGYEIREIGGNEIAIDRKITLSFTAGRKNIICKDVEFWIPRQEGVDTDNDGVTDVLLGLPELLKHHMVTVDPDFCNEPEEGLEVLSKRAREEADKPMICLGTKYPQIRVRGK